MLQVCSLASLPECFFQVEQNSFSPSAASCIIISTPADIQQILLVSDVSLEQLALKADAMLADRAPTWSIATVSAATTTYAVTLGSFAAHIATLSEAVQKISTQERSHSRPHFRTPSPPRKDWSKPRKLGTPVFRGLRRRLLDKHFPSSRTLEHIAHQHLWRAFEDPLAGRRDRPTIPVDLPRPDVPQPIIGADFLAHYSLTVNLQVLPGTCAFKNILWEFPALTKPINRATQPRHECRHHIMTHGPPAHSRCRPLAADRCRSARAELDHMIYPLPHLHSSHELSGCTVFSRIDLMRAFCQIPITEEDIPKTVVITPFGLFEFLRMPFGLRNATHTFQRFINDVIRGLEGVFAYIDDIFVASTSEADHARHLRALFGRLQGAGVVVNPGKCQFGVASLSFLGHTVTPQGITPKQEKVTAIRKFPRPATEKQLRKFLGMFNFYRRFVPRCAQLLKPLHALITPNRASKNTKIKWTSPTNEAFEACKEALASTALLNHPLPEAPLNIAVNASDTAIGAVLQQHQGKQWKLTAFFLQTLSPCLSRYSAFGRELLAAYSAVKHFLPFVEAEQLHILTDHKPLTFALHSRTRRQSPREERHLDYISQFTTDFRHIRGADNHIRSDPHRRRSGLSSGQQRAGRVYDSSHRGPVFP
ncbi:reverse transcriptase [Penaeus vannamei]|uniref:RNA-directed DNA polymerase n=1 Tax=Penaeus vannamei TaxID=6689 RepID=A0A3R7LXI1_PENVA|nr:reverse transcriptase [Penaeus vannamei]